MRFFPVTVFALLAVPLWAVAQGDMPFTGWTDESIQALISGAVPVVLAALAILVWNLWFALSRSLPEKPVSLMRYGVKPFVWAALVLTTGLAFTAYRVYTVQQETYGSGWARFQSEVDRVEADIQGQFEGVLPALRGIRGMVVATHSVSPTAFQDWVGSRDVGLEFPGISGLGLVQRIQPRNAPEQYVVKYIEPLETNRPWRGVDLAKNPMARAAADRAMQSGRPSLSGGMTLEFDGEKRTVALYFLPIYAAVKTPLTQDQRVKTLRGWALAPVVLGDLLVHTVGMARGQVEFQFFDGVESATKRLMFDSTTPLADTVALQGVESRRSALFTVERFILVSGQFFQLRAHTTSDFEHSIDRGAPLRLAFTGASLAVLASLIVWLLLVGRARAVSLAGAMTQDLHRLAMVAQRTSNAVVITDVNRRMTWVNEGFTRITGYSFEEAIGKHPRDLLQSEKTSLKTVEAISNDLNLRRASKQLISNRHKDGHDYWLDLEIQPLQGPSGQLIGFMAIESDVTDMVHAQEALAQERERMQRILEGTDAGTWEWNVESGAHLINARTAELLGYALEELQPMDHERWIGLKHPDDRKNTARAMNDYLGGKTRVYDNVSRIQHKDGRWIWVHARGKVSKRLPNGEPQWLAGTYLDVSAHRESELAHKKTAQMLQLVLDSAVDVAVIATDTKQAITLFNAGAERLLGYTAAEVVDKHDSSLFLDAAQLAAIGAPLALVLGRPPTSQELFDEVVTSAQQSQWTFWRKDGSSTPVSLAISPMLEESGTTVGYLGLAQDISQQLEYQQSLRTAMQAAEQASVAKSQFLANMSHEIRTPMNAILGMLNLLGNTPLTERQRDYADKTQGAARSLLGLLNDLLDFSKVEAGKMELDLEPFAVEAMLGDLSVILSANLDGEGVDLVFDIDPAIPPMLVGDAMRLKQILINLGGNAVKFTALGEVVIQWRLLAHTPEQVTIKIAVRDTGIGIAPENLVKIFEGFSQAESSTTRRYGGTGLGLSICQRLVTLMGGNLELTSELGQGSTFSFELTLPVHQSQMDEKKPGTARPLHVLLVDDNAVGLQAAAVTMRALDWQVVTASSGEQALERVKECLDRGLESLDMVFVDWQMPGMDGWETLRSIRRLYANTTPPRMVMLSGKGRELLEQRSVREQELLSGFLVKPLTATMLRSTVDASPIQTTNVVGRGSVAGASGPPAKRQRLKGMRILVVEDNPINQQVAKGLLSAEGAQVTLAINGRVGLDTIAGADPQFDAVLMDLQMPVMGGLEAVRAIRWDLGLHNLPVIAITANAMALDRLACLEAGMNDHVGKPFDLTHLVEMLVRYTQWTLDAPEALPLEAAVAVPPAVKPSAGTV